MSDCFRNPTCLGLMMDGIPKRGEAALVVIDVQEKFRPVIYDVQTVVSNIEKLIKAFKVFKIPVFVTEQYPEGLGATFPEIKSLIDSEPTSKLEFSCFNCSDFKQKLQDSGMRALIISGIEAHVCVLQTALDAIAEGYEVYLVEDAVSSRKESDKNTAIARAAQSGIYRVSTEMIIFQLMEKAGTEDFKEIQKIVK